mmetsp:Transcript_26726/g.72131  ORF Transcript_26726/g.72131 Transcript_26726/m.72131 type:complete len:211 (-) Transcript_26726:463-1095(-)
MHHYYKCSVVRVHRCPSGGVILRSMRFAAAPTPHTHESSSLLRRCCTDTKRRTSGACDSSLGRETLIDTRGAAIYWSKDVPGGSNSPKPHSFLAIATRVVGSCASSTSPLLPSLEDFTRRAELSWYHTSSKPCLRYKFSAGVLSSSTRSQMSSPLQPSVVRTNSSQLWSNRCPRPVPRVSLRTARLESTGRMACAVRNAVASSWSPALRY